MTIIAQILRFRGYNILYLIIVNIFVRSYLQFDFSWL